MEKGNKIDEQSGILDPSAYGFGDARGPLKAFCFFYILFIAKVLSCFAIRTEEIQLTALKNFQVSKALVVAAEKVPFNVPNRRFET